MKAKKIHKLLAVVLAFCVVASYSFAFEGGIAYAAKKAKKVKVTSITLNHKVITIKKGKTLKLKTTIKPAKAKKSAKIVWKTSSKKLATVSTKGVVKAKKPKKAKKVKITATVKGTKKKAVCTVWIGTPVKTVTLAASALTMKTGETVSAGAKVSPAKATVKTITYSSDNTAVATVDKKGNIKAVSAGTAVITAKPVDEAGKAAKMTVTVENPVVPVTGVTLDAATKTLEKRQSFTLTATVAPADATNKAVTFTSSDSKVATVDANGKVTAAGRGSADITVKTADGGKTAVCKVTVKYSAETVIGTAEELTQDLIEAVKSGEITKLIIQSSENLNLTLPEGDFSKTSLVVDAPKGHIENSANFKDVLIKAVSGSTYVEHAVGNDITYQADSGRIEISEGASASVSVAPGAQSLELVNNGSVSNLNVDTKSSIDITGASQSSIPVQVASAAGGSVISTAQELAIDTEAKIDLNINPGGEYTQVNIVNKKSEAEAAAVVPDVAGLGVITVSNNGEHFQNVVAQNSGNVSVKAVTVAGTVSCADGTAASGVKLSLVPYTSEMSASQVKAAPAKYSADASANGAYSVSNVALGNYYLLVQKSGYADAVSKIIITSNAGDKFNAAPVTLVKAEDAAKKGSLSGAISDAETGEAAESGLMLMLREGGNNVSGNVIATATTGQDGKFAFSGSYNFGQYTIEVVDQRGDSESRYITTSYDAFIKAEGDNTANGTASRIIKDEQIRFELRWGTEASGASSDLDSHLIGPKASGEGVFHTWYSDMGYSDSIGGADNYFRYADLDVDDTDYEGPETTTIYKKSSGTYSFYIHDFTNRENNKSDQMSRSSAVVRVYIGSRLMETFNVPANKAGILWHVCDYDADRNKIISVNEMMSTWAGEPEDVGLSAEDILNNQKTRLNRLIADAEPIQAGLPVSELKTNGSTLIKAAKDAVASNDVQKMKDAYEPLSEWVSSAESAADVKDISGEGITNWYTDSVWSEDDEELLYREIILKGESETAPDLASLTVTPYQPESTIEWGASDKDGYLKTLTVKFGTVSRTWYVKYEVDEEYLLGIDSVTATVTGEDEEESDLVSDWDTDWFGEDADEYRVLNIWFRTDEYPENVEIIPRHDNATVTFKASDKDGYAKIATITNGSRSRDYYLKYDVPSYIKFELDITDKDGNSLWHSRNDGDEDEVASYLVKGDTETMPELTELKIVPTYKNTSASAVQASDKEGYDGMFTLTCGDEQRTYYINYAPDLEIDRVTYMAADGDSSYEAEASTNIYTDYESGMDVIRVYGSWDSLPADLNYVPVAADAKAVYSADDSSDKYDGIVTVTLGSTSEQYYVEYMPEGCLGLEASSASDPTLGIDPYAEADDEIYVDGYEYPFYPTIISGATEEMPSDVVFGNKYADSVDVVDYNKDGCVKLVTVRYREYSETYLIRYQISTEAAFGFDLAVNDAEYGDVFAIETGGYGEDGPITYVYGPYINLPVDKLTATARNPEATAEVVALTDSEYPARVDVTYKGTTRSFYISYERGEGIDNAFAFDITDKNGNVVYPGFTFDDMTIDDDGCYHYEGFVDTEKVFPNVDIDPAGNVQWSVSEGADEGNNPLLVVTLTFADETRTVYIHYTQPAGEEESAEG